MWPRMADPDKEGIDLHSDDSRRWFIATSQGLIFSQAAPLTEEDRLEAKSTLEPNDKPGVSPDKKVEIKEAKKKGKRNLNIV